MKSIKILLQNNNTMKKSIGLLGLFFATAAVAQQPKLQSVYQDNTYQFTGVAVSAKGRLFVTYPRWSDTYKYGVVEVVNGQARPYPDEATNNWHPGDDGKDKWVCVQTAYVDDNDYLYIVDPAAPKLGEVYNGSAKVVKYDLNTNQVVKTYRFPGTIDNQSYLNDIRVDTKKQIAYLTNSGTGGIVVLDLASGKSRQVLQAHKSVHPDPNVKFIVDGHELKKQGQPVAFQSDGIALSPDRSYLYYKTITDKRLFRIKTAALNDSTLTAQQLAGAVEDLGNMANTDGMIFDAKSNLYLGDPTTYSMMHVTPDLKPHTWIKDDRLIWPDTYSISKDGYIYITTSQINKQPDYNDGVNKRTSAYMVYKVKLP
jgi:sugar lactone lactonase YvrE